MTIIGAHLKRLLCQLYWPLLVGFVIAWPNPCLAQVTGVFFPSVVGEVQQPGSTPFPQPAPGDIPYFEQAKMQLQGQLDQERHPYIDFCTAYANQSLIPQTGQMDSFTPQIAEFGFFPTKQTELRFSYIPTIFGEAGLRKPRAFGQEYRAAFRYQPLDRLKLAGQVGIYNFAQTSQIRGGTEVLGAFSAQYAIHDRFHVTAGYRRDILGNTLLSTTGLNLPGTDNLVGRVSQNMFFVMLDGRVTRKTAVSFLYGGGWDAGSRVQTNPFQEFGLSVNRSLYSRDPRSHLSSVNFSYQFLSFNYKYNLIGVGNLALVTQPQSPSTTQAILASSALGQTQIPAPPGQQQAGVGGYFSPQQFYGNFWGLSASGRAWGPIYWRGGLGPSIANAAARGGGRLDQTVPGGTALAAVTARVNRHVSIEYGWFYLQAADLYRRNVIYNQMRYTF